jgi:hypothetical protein
MFDWSDPNTYWLNVTDIVLGLVVLACIAFVGQAVLREALARFSAKFALPQDRHSLAVPELGLTMADGGEAVDNKQPNSRTK